MHAALLASSCDNSFRPIDPGAPPFSVVGFLDASADTQWIRISVLRTVLRASADPTGVAATLEELGSGRIIELHDSAMGYATALGSDPVYTHNFWTAEPISPGATYRFRAQGRGGALAEAVVRIPQEYDLEFWVSQGYSRLSDVHAAGLRQVAFLFWNLDYYTAGQVTLHPSVLESTAPCPKL